MKRKISFFIVVLHLCVSINSYSIQLLAPLGTTETGFKPINNDDIVKQVKELEEYYGEYSTRYRDYRIRNVHEEAAVEYLKNKHSSRIWDILFKPAGYYERHDTEKLYNSLLLKLPAETISSFIGYYMHEISQRIENWYYEDEYRGVINDVADYIWSMSEKRKAILESLPQNIGQWESQHIAHRILHNILLLMIQKYGVDKTLEVGGVLAVSNILKHDVFNESGNIIKMLSSAQLNDAIRNMSSYEARHLLYICRDRPSYFDVMRRVLESIGPEYAAEVYAKDSEKSELDGMLYCLGDKKAEYEAAIAAKRKQMEEDEFEKVFAAKGKPLLDFFNYSDAPLDEVMKAKVVEGTANLKSAKRYAIALADLFEKYGRENVVAKALEIRARMFEVIYSDHQRNGNSMDVSPFTLSRSWAFWDLAKQYYFFTNPDQADNKYTVEDPMVSAKKQEEIINRHLGWEIYGNIHLQAKRKFKDSRINELLNKPFNQYNTLSSKDLAELGRLFRESELPKNRLLTRVMRALIGDKKTGYEVAITDKLRQMEEDEFENVFAAKGKPLLDFLNYSDAPFDEVIKANVVKNTANSKSAKRYAIALADLFEKYGRENVVAKALEIRARMFEVIDSDQQRNGYRTGVLLSTLSRSWAFWDLAKQYYFFTNPDQADNKYTVEDPMVSAKKQEEIINRRLGREIYANKYLQTIRKFEDSRINELLNKPFNQYKTLSSKEFAELGRLFRESELPKNRLVSRVMRVVKSAYEAL